MIVGHGRIVADLKRLADGRRLAHGYLFFGPPRVGKRTVALGLAEYLEGFGFDAVPLRGAPLSDATVVQPDAERTIGIDRIRELRNFVSQFPNRSPYRMVIIDDAELMTREAQNALLKVAEEPPAAALIVLVVQDPERLLPTLRSRFQKLYFAPPATAVVVEWLVKEHRMPKARAMEVAVHSFGAPGLAWAFLNDEKFGERYETARQFLAMPSAGRQAFIKDFTDKGEHEDFDLGQFLDAALIALAASRRRDEPALWHRLLELRRQADYVNVNPRLQLTALAHEL